MAKRAGAADDDTIGQGTIGGDANTAANEHHHLPNEPEGPSDDLIMRYVAQIDAQQAEVDKHAAAYKGAKKALTTIRSKARADKIKLKTLDQQMANRTLPRHEQRRDLEDSDRYAVLLGNVTWDDADLFAKESDQHVRDELDWEGQGYADGKRGLPPKAPAECPPEYHQAYLRAHAKGADDLVAVLGGKKPTDLVAETVGG